MKLFHAQLILCKLIDTSKGGGEGAVSAFHGVITLTILKVGRRRESGTKELSKNWEVQRCAEREREERKGGEKTWGKKEKCGELLAFTLR